MSQELDTAMRAALIEVAINEKKAKDIKGSFVKAKDIAIATDGLTMKKGTRMIQVSYWDGKRQIIEPLLIWSTG